MGNVGGEGLFPVFVNVRKMFIMHTNKENEPSYDGDRHVESSVCIDINGFLITMGHAQQLRTSLAFYVCILSWG